MPTLPRIGGANVAAIPGKRFAGQRGVGFVRPFRSQSFSTINAFVTGVTRDSTGVALGNCVVQLFRTVDDAIVLESTSDAGGNFSLYPPVTGPFYIVAYKIGAPDIAGTTINTLVPA